MSTRRKPNPSSGNLLRYGSTLKRNDFDTKKGFYTIRLIRYNGNIYFHKMLDNRVVEIINLTNQEVSLTHTLVIVKGENTYRRTTDWDLGAIKRYYIDKHGEDIDQLYIDGYRIYSKQNNPAP